MAANQGYWIDVYLGPRKKKQFFVSKRAYINSMPTTTREGADTGDGGITSEKCDPGSIAYCLEDGSLWILDKETDSWIEQ